MDLGILHARIMHRRLTPKVNAFQYGAFYLVVPLSRMHDLARGRLFGVDRFGLMALHARDHGPRDGSPLEPWARTLLHDHDATEADGEIVLVTLPRILHYVFNPVSFWLCLDRAGALRAVISEVSNTYGERHCYLSRHADGRAILPGESLDAPKRFHVSPFLDREGRYRFGFAFADERLQVRIDHSRNDETVLVTALTGKIVPYSTKALFQAACRHPLVTLKVIGLIHWQALRLFRKGIGWRDKPEPLSPPLTVSDA